MERKLPVIGLTSSFMIHEQSEQVFLPLSYFTAIRHFGGIPLLIPVQAEQAELDFLMDCCDGLILTGGDDIDPHLFGEEKLNASVITAPKRDMQEGRIIEMATERKLPVLGICRGVQMLNVHFGGTLWQDIPTQKPSTVNHRMEKPYHRTSHVCRLVPEMPLHALCGGDIIGVNSHHHQAIKDLAPGFISMGIAEDGIVEAIYDPGRPFCWGVQWHPERIWDIEESSAKIFKVFIEACK